MHLERIYESGIIPRNNQFRHSPMQMDTGKAAVPAPGAMMEEALDEWKESTN